MACRDDLYTRRPTTSIARKVVGRAVWTLCSSFSWYIYIFLYTYRMALFQVHQGRNEFAYVGGLGKFCSLTIVFFAVPMGFKLDSSSLKKIYIHYHLGWYVSNHQWSFTILSVRYSSFFTSPLWYWIFLTKTGGSMFSWWLTQPTFSALQVFFFGNANADVHDLALWYHNSCWLYTPKN